MEFAKKRNPPVNDPVEDVAETEPPAAPTSKSAPQSETDFFTLVTKLSDRMKFADPQDSVPTAKKIPLTIKRKEPIPEPEPIDDPEPTPAPRKVIPKPASPIEIPKATTKKNPKAPKGSPVDTPEQSSESSESESDYSPSPPPKRKSKSKYKSPKASKRKPRRPPTPFSSEEEEEEEDEYDYYMPSLIDDLPYDAPPKYVDYDTFVRTISRLQQIPFI